MTSWKEEEGLITAEVQTTVKVDEDTWVVVFVHGTKDTTGFRSLFPIVTNVLVDGKKYPESFDPAELAVFHADPNVWAPAWALANPIFIDADVDGKFTPSDWIGLNYSDKLQFIRFSKRISSVSISAALPSAKKKSCNWLNHRNALLAKGNQ